MLKTINTTTTSQPTDATKAAPAIICLITFISSREAGKTRSIAFSIAVLISSTTSIRTLAITNAVHCQNFSGSHTPTIRTKITRVIITRKFCSVSITEKSPSNACLKLLINFVILIIQSLSIFMTALELILCEILDERKSLRPAARRLGSANGSRAKNFLPPTPSIFCPLAKKSSCEKLKDELVSK